MDKPKNSQFIFFGSADFAAIFFEKLFESSFVPAAVVCAPDKPFGRKKVITPPAVKSLILNRETWNIEKRPEILQPEFLDSNFKIQISRFKPEFAVVAAYPKIIRQEIIDLFPKGMIVVHPSLLPAYRGASPIQSALLNGEKKTGTALFLIDELVDHGPVLDTAELEIEESDNYKTLHDKLAELSAELFIKTFPKFLAGEIKPQEQNHALATFTKKFKTEDGFIEFEDIEKALAGDTGLAEKIHNKIRALYEEPGAWTIIDGKRVKLLESKIENEKLVLVSVLPEGKKAMHWEQFEKSLNIL